MKLIIGLGNPGEKYERTRHNTGVRAVRAFQGAHADVFGEWREKFESLVSEGKIGKKKVALLLPQTFMNDSGRAVAAAVQFWKLTPADVVVVFDDADLPLGTVRFRASGSDGGHNGLGDILVAFGTKEVPRIKIGIGTELRGRVPLDEFVLGTFTAEEEKTLTLAIETTVTEIEKMVH